MPHDEKDIDWDDVGMKMRWCFTKLIYNIKRNYVWWILELKTPWLTYKPPQIEADDTKIQTHYLNYLKIFSSSKKLRIAISCWPNFPCIQPTKQLQIHLIKNGKATHSSNMNTWDVLHLIV